VEIEFAETKETIATLQNDMKELRTLAAVPTPLDVGVSRQSEAASSPDRVTELQADLKHLVYFLSTQKPGNEGSNFVEDKTADAVIGTLTNYPSNILGDWTKAKKKMPMDIIDASSITSTSSTPT
jgi:hypothetical protein